MRDNLLAAAERPRWHSFIGDILRPGHNEKAYYEQVDRALSVLGLDDLADAFPTDLSHGQRKLIGVARALAADPKLVLLDEPAAGLDTAESQLLGVHLRQFLTQGMSVFLIDHDMGLVLNVCDYIYVLDFGKVIAHGTPAEVRADPDRDQGIPRRVGGRGAGQASAPRSVGTDGRTATMGERLIDINGLHAGYDGIPVVRDLDAARRRR